MPAHSRVPVFAPSAARLKADWRQLCRTIGERRAGTAGERRAAEYIADQFAQAGLTARIESFACRTLRQATSSVAARGPGGWSDFASRALVGSPSLPGRGQVQGDLVFLEYPETSHRLRRDSLRGKVAVVFGPLPTDLAMHRKLIAARPAAVLHADDRLPFGWPKSDGLFPYWVEIAGAVPTLSIAYAAAWRFRAEGFTRARVSVRTVHAAGRSGNVVATLPGSDPAAPAILFGAHHDTQADNIGADDNASGVVCLLELARLLAGGPARRRTLHFVSFGAEEQLSVGSAAYVRRHRPGPDQLGLMVNFDSISSPLGHSHLFHSGQARLKEFFLGGLRRRGYDASPDETVTPFADHFPFTACGIPAVWFYRSNVRWGQRWQHHTPQDALANVSAEPVVSLLRGLAPLVAELAAAHSWPFGRRMPAALAAQTAHFARTLFGLRPGR